MSDERIESSLAVVPWAALYSRLDASERGATHELEIEPELLVIDNLPTEDLPEVLVSPATWRRTPPVAKAKPTPVPVMFTPPPRRVKPRPSAARVAPPRQLGWLETPVIGLSHIAVLVVSGTMFGIGLSAFALELLSAMPGLEFLKL